MGWVDHRCSPRRINRLCGQKCGNAYFQSILDKSQNINIQRAVVQWMTNRKMSGDDTTAIPGTVHLVDLRPRHVESGAGNGGEANKDSIVLVLSRRMIQMIL